MLHSTATAHICYSPLPRKIHQTSIPMLFFSDPKCPAPPSLRCARGEDDSDASSEASSFEILNADDFEGILLLRELALEPTGPDSPGPDSTTTTAAAAAADVAANVAAERRKKSLLWSPPPFLNNNTKEIDNFPVGAKVFVCTKPSNLPDWPAVWSGPYTILVADASHNHVRVDCPRRSPPARGSGPWYSLNDVSKHDPSAEAEELYREARRRFELRQREKKNRNS